MMRAIIEIGSGIILAVLVFMQSCQDNEDGIVNHNTQDSASDSVSVRDSSNDNSDNTHALTYPSGDAFQVSDILLSEDVVEINVAFSGGCEEHTFNYHITSQAPGHATMFLQHDANGDMCEAWLTKSLTIPVSTIKNKASITGNAFELSLINSNDSTVHKIDITASEPEEGDIPENLLGGEECIQHVVAKQVVCGSGVWGNIWLKMPDTTFYLQPVELSNEIGNLSNIKENRTYRVGFSTDIDNHCCEDEVVCLAYPGPSIPVKLLCIEPDD